MLESALLTNLLLGGILILLALALRQLGRVVARLERIGREEAPPSPLPDSAEKVGEPAEEAGGGMFERFLDANPGLRDESKADQSAAYRKWRKAQGLNWQSR
jgi:hypothetical protein